MMFGRLSLCGRPGVPSIRRKSVPKYGLRCFSYSPNSVLNPSESDNNLVRKKINELVKWYEQVTGMDEVRLMQNRVIEAQDRFVSAQDSRRKLASELIAAQNKLKEIHAELNTTSRGEERFLQLVTEEHKILKDERRINSEFAISERDERDSFNMLSSRLKESHEKERAQADRTKYWSIIASISGTVLGIVGSSMNNKLKMRELRNLVSESATKNSSWTQDKELTSLFSDIKESLRQNSEHFVHRITNSNGGKQQEQFDYITRIYNEVKNVQNMLKSSQSVDGQLMIIPTDVDTLLSQHKKDITYTIIGTAVLFTIFTFIFHK